MLKLNKKIITSTIVAITIAVFLIALTLLYKKQHTPRVKPVIVQKTVNDPFMSVASSVYSLDTFTQFDKTLDEAFQHNALVFDNLISKINHHTLSSTWQEEAKQFTFSIHVPGIDPKAINITIQNGILSITATQKSQSYFYYRFLLPDTADTEKITAKLQRGILEIIIPKMEKVPAKKIMIQEA